MVLKKHMKLKNFLYIFFIIVFFFINYILHLTKNYAFDTIGFVYAIREQILFQIFHSYHIIFLPVQILFIKLFQPDDVLTLLQSINAIVSIIALCIMYFVFVKITSNRIISFLTVLLSGTTLWYFRYAVDLEIKAYNALVTNIIILILLNYKFNRKKLYLYLMPAFIIAVLFHQINFFLLPAILFALFYKKTPIKNILIFLFMSGFVLLSVYSIIGIVYLDIKNIKEFYNWITYYKQLGYWGGLTYSTIYESLMGFAWSITGKGKIKVIGLYLFIICYIIIFIKERKYILKNNMFEFILFLLWFLFQSAVVIYWHPLNIENWYSQLAIWIPFVIISNYIYNNYFKSIIVIVILIIVLNYINVYSTYIKPYKNIESNVNLGLTFRINELLQPDENLIIAGEGYNANITMYIKYFADKINLFSIDEIFVKNLSDFEKAKQNILQIKTAYIFSDIIENKNNIIQTLENKHNIEDGKLYELLIKNIFNKTNTKTKIMLNDEDYIIKY